MRFISFLGILYLTVISTPALSSDTSIDFEACSKLISDAEENTDINTDVYAKCGFDDENIVWTKWAAYVSQKNHKKAYHIYNKICAFARAFSKKSLQKRKKSNFLEKLDEFFCAMRKIIKPIFRHCTHIFNATPIFPG